MKIAGLILASGLSERFGERNKLLLPVGAEPLIRRTVRVFLAADLDPVLVVLGHQRNEVEAALEGLAVTLVENPDFRQGQSRALVRGVTALPHEIKAAVIGVADQPFLSSDVLRRLVSTYRETDAPLVVPRYAGRRGNPALFARSLFAELLAIEGDQGGRPVQQAHAEEIAWLDIPDARLGLDIDSEGDWRSYEL